MKNKYSNSGLMRFKPNLGRTQRHHLSIVGPLVSDSLHTVLINSICVKGEVIRLSSQKNRAVVKPHTLRQQGERPVTFRKS